jgi:hypothetical protein
LAGVDRQDPAQCLRGGLGVGAPQRGPGLGGRGVALGEAASGLVEHVLGLRTLRGEGDGFLRALDGRFEAAVLRSPGGSTHR